MSNLIFSHFFVRIPILFIFFEKCIEVEELLNRIENSEDINENVWSSMFFFYFLLYAYILI